MLTRRLITDTCPFEAPIWLHPVIIIRNCIWKGPFSVVGMIVVTTIYDYRNPSVMIARIIALSSSWFVWGLDGSVENCLVVNDSERRNPQL